MKHPQNDHEDHPSWHENSYMFCDQKLKESQQKLRQLHDQNFRNEGKPLQNKYWRQKKERNAKEQDCEQGGSRDFENEGHGEGGGERGWRSM